ncbi:MAG: MFS transporter, partial [Acidimicrobiales bacterium]
LALLLDPTGSPWVSTCVLGFGTGGLFPLGVTMLVDHVPDPAASARLSAMAFLITYLVAAAGPTVLGGLKDVTGGFHTGWLVLVVTEVAVCVIIGALTPKRRLSAAGAAHTTIVRKTV